MRVALEIRTSLRPERPGTPPEGNVKQGESRERRGEKRQKTGRTETDRRSEGARAKGTERQRRTQHQSAQEGEKKERSRNGGAKVVTPSVKISGWLWGYEQSQRASEHNETIRGGEALTVLDQSAARKARYQKVEKKRGETNQGRTRRQGDVRPINRH